MNLFSYRCNFNGTYTHTHTRIYEIYLVYPPMKTHFMCAFEFYHLQRWLEVVYVTLPLYYLCSLYCLILRKIYKKYYVRIFYEFKFFSGYRSIFKVI